MGCDQSDIAAFDEMFNTGNEGQKPAQNTQPQQVHPYASPQPAAQPPGYGQGGQQTKGHPQQVQPAPIYAPQQVQVQRETKDAKPVSGPKKKREPREVLAYSVDFSDDFLNHHLKYELSMSKLTSKSRIKRRQILEHILLQKYWGNVGGQSFNSMSYFQSLQSAWMQRTMLDIWQGAHNDFFNLEVEEKIVRRKVAEQYMFELYELKEYVDAGLGNLNAFVDKTRCQLGEFMQYSDDALFSIFRKLKERYPQTGKTEKIKFPDVPSTSTSMNLFDNFKSKSFSDVDNLNIQTLYADLSFLLQKAIEEQDTFKSDMKLILADDVLACPKVGKVTKDGKSEFNACAVRRVFIKWAQNLLQKCPELKKTKAFIQFVKAKFKLANNFFYKSYVQDSTHKIVIECLCYLLEEAKFNEMKQKRKEFIFNIYDLLRCKIKRNTAEEIVELLTKMQNTKVTKNGKKFEVIRVKNRFQTNNRDLLINFRYGDVLIGQAQLCIDDANISHTTKLNYEFCHYIYELERSLFGPTLELMMQYEDYERPDISMSFQAEDLVKKREKAGPLSVQKVDRKCLQGHEMVSLVGNFFFGDDSTQAVSATCNFCDRETNSDVRYDYCFQCNCFLCRQCTEDYKKFNPKTSLVSVQRDQLAIAITDENQLRSECAKNKSLVVLFHCETISASQVMKDAMIYHQSKLCMQPNKTIPKIAIATYSNANIKNLCGKLQIKQFPTTVLFDGQAKAVRTIIGSSWLEVPFLYETQKRIVSGQSIELDVSCTKCMGKMEFTQLPEDTVLICEGCLNNSVPIDIPEQYLGVGAFCGQQHYRCVNCCYTALDIPSTYRDQCGTSYLSSSFVQPKLRKCPTGHNLTYTRKNLLKTWEFKCFGCKQMQLFDDDNGMGVCETCKVGLCGKCMGSFLPTLKQLHKMPDLCNNYVESTAEQACKCICERHFKKVYNTRFYSLQQMVQKEQSGSGEVWKCSLCQVVRKDGINHLACFNCPKLAELSEGKIKMNFEVCLQCAAKSQILMQQPKGKVTEVPSFFVDTKGHAMVKTSFGYDFDLTFVCAGGCKRRFYANSERIYCKTCKMNYCIDCLDSLFNANPPKCNQVCPKNHQLKLQYRVKSLSFCDGCMKVNGNEHFKCADCDYDLCTTCSQISTHFVGKSLDKLKKGMMDQLGFGEQYQAILREEAAQQQNQQQQQQYQQQQYQQEVNYNWGGDVYEPQEQEQDDFGNFGDLF